MHLCVLLQILHCVDYNGTGFDTLAIMKVMRFVALIIDFRMNAGSVASVPRRTFGSFGSFGLSEWVEGREAAWKSSENGIQVKWEFVVNSLWQYWTTLSAPPPLPHKNISPFNGRLYRPNRILNCANPTSGDATIAIIHGETDNRWNNNEWNELTIKFRDEAKVRWSMFAKQKKKEFGFVQSEV